MNNFTLIGIDGGATKVNVWDITYNAEEQNFALGQFNCEKKYSEIPRFITSFSPVNIQEQLKNRGESFAEPTADEQLMETVYVEACATALKEVYIQSDKKPLLIGIGMPGLKSANKRGIEVVANGPRMLNYCTLLEERLASMDIELYAPIAHLGSDADYCGIGENFAETGSFKDIEDGYYLGGGTGVADALKLNNSLYPLDVVKIWMAKSWEFKSAEGLSLERYCSAAGIQSIYADLSEQDINTLTENNIYPLHIASLAAQGDKAAIQTYKIVLENLAKLLYSRITTLSIGWQGDFEFMNPDKPELSISHGRLGRVFDRIVIGQRLGELLDSADGTKLLFMPLKEKLFGLIKSNANLSDDVKDYYQDLDQILVTSKLREAPALGAGIDAFLNWKENN